MKKDLLTQMIYRIVLCCVAGLATLLTFRFFHNVYVDSKNPQWEWIKTLEGFDWQFLKYYTNISNWFVFAVSVIVLNDNVKRVKAGEKYGHNRVVPKLKFMTTVMILVTFMVYNFTLESPFTIRYWRNLYSLTCHVFAPVLFILDFFLFDEHKKVEWYYPLISTIIPLIYVVYILVLGACIKDFKYPYFFLDVSRYGYGGVALWVLGLTVVFIGLGYLLWLYDKLVKVDGKLKLDLPKRKKTVAAAEVAAADSLQNPNQISSENALKSDEDE